VWIGFAMGEMETIEKKQKEVQKMKSLKVFLPAIIAIMSFLTDSANAQNKNILNAQEILIIKGKFTAFEGNEAIGNSNINFDNFGKELLIADLDAEGNYLLIFDKEQLDFPLRMNFNIEGYEKFTAKKITAKDDFVKMDIVLTPLEGQAKNTSELQKPIHKWTSTSVVSTTILKLD
jgi:hypothetical protein